jgi:hypothetical protein
MALTYDEVLEFVRQHGEVTAYTGSGERATPVRDDEPDAAWMVELCADIFRFRGKRYTKVQFHRLVRAWGMTRSI